MTKLLTSGILAAAVNAEFVAKPVILGTLPSNSVILAFKSVFFYLFLFRFFICITNFLF